MATLGTTNQPEAVTVSYHTSPSPDVWERIQADLHRQLPLKNLAWKSTSRPVRTIDQVHLHFQPLYPSDATKQLITATPEVQSSARESVELSRPLLHTLFVACDDNEAYRTIVKQEIRTWLDFVQGLPTAEWLIIHVTAAAKPNAGGIFRTKSGVLDKIKADFNVPKKDRCIQLSHFGGSNPTDSANHDVTQWKELLPRLKEGIIAAFDVSVAEMEESVRGLDSRRGSLEWNFGEYFAAKSDLANRFASMSLFEDCLLQYEELDAALFQRLRDSPGEWIGKGGGTDQGDDSRSVLTHDAKPYIQLVARGDISIFDIKIYLFSQHTKLLGQLDRLEDAVSRATIFVTTFSAFLRQYEASLIPYFIESWTYSACIDLVDWCESQITGKDLPTMQLNGVLRLCAQLLELAHNQLDKLGIYVGHLPNIHPFAMAIPSYMRSKDQVPRVPGPITRADLSASLNDPALFEKLYIALANRTIRMYVKSGRKRSALKLHLAVAAFEETQARDEHAQRLFTHLPAHYVDDKWATIESSLLDRCATLQSRLGMWKEWLLSVLALVRSGVTHEAGRWSQDVMLRDGQMDTLALATRLMTNIKDQASKLEKDFAAIAFPTFVVALATNIGRSAEPQEGSIVTACVRNYLPCSVDIDTLRMKLSGLRYDALWFTSGPQKLNPGDTVIDLFCPTPVAEALILDISQIRISRIIFQYYHRSSTSGSSSVTNGHPKTPLEVSFAKDPLALDVHLKLPQDISMSPHRFCLFTLFTGRNRLAKANITLNSEGRVNFFLKHCKAMNDTLNLQCNESTMEVRDVEPNVKIVISVPFAPSTTESHVQVLVSVDHYVHGQEEARRSFRKSCDLTMALPLVVNVQDFVRPNSIISRFSVSTDGKNSLNIHSVALEIPAPFSVMPGLSLQGDSTLVVASQAANFLFKLIPPDMPHFEAPAMKLVLKYRLLIDEMVDILRLRLEKILDHLPRQKAHLPSLLDSLRLYLGDSAQTSTSLDYSVNRRLNLGSFDPLHWDKVCLEMEKADESRNDLMTSLRKIFEDTVDVDSAIELATPWHTLTIPMELPRVSVLNTIEFCQKSPPRHLQLGKPLLVDLVIKTSFRWCGSVKIFEELQKNLPNMIYEIVPHLSDWLVSGTTRGNFLAKDKAETVVRLSFVPMRYGKLCFPEVFISVSETVTEITTETHHLNRIDSIAVQPSSTDSSQYHIPESSLQLNTSPSLSVSWLSDGPSAIWPRKDSGPALTREGSVALSGV
ncbi:hypothetical protein DFH28DRAFT_1047952 [Melampsora americana]|nr:hypothetical protein DFH28DRAFT_1047952 [Melampsora americana]